MSNNKESKMNAESRKKTRQKIDNDKPNISSSSSSSSSSSTSSSDSSKNDIKNADIINDEEEQHKRQLEELLNEEDYPSSPERGGNMIIANDAKTTPRTRAIQNGLTTATYNEHNTINIDNRMATTKTVTDTTGRGTRERALSYSSSVSSSSSSNTSSGSSSSSSLSSSSDKPNANNNNASNNDDMGINHTTCNANNDNNIDNNINNNNGDEGNSLNLQNQNQHNKKATPTTITALHVAETASSQSAFDRAMTNGSHIQSSYGRSKDNHIDIDYDQESSFHPTELNGVDYNNQDPSEATPSDEMFSLKEVTTVDEDDDAIETMLPQTSLSLSHSEETIDYNNNKMTAPSHTNTITRGLDIDALIQKTSTASLESIVEPMSEHKHVEKESVTSTELNYDMKKQDDNQASISNYASQPISPPTMQYIPGPQTIRPKSNDSNIPDVLTTVRNKIESMRKVDMKHYHHDEDEKTRQHKENLRRSLQQSLSAAVLVSLAHKRYERRKLAAIEIEKIVRNLVYARDLERVNAMLQLLSDDYVRSTNEDARKGGVVALAACAIGLKKAHEIKDAVRKVNESKDLILASVIHACQDHSQRVRYYATESLFNVIKVLPALAIEHFFVLFEILRSLWADVDVDVRSGAELFDKKLKEIIVGSINTGQFNADLCIPLFARYVHMRNKPTKRLTLSWLQQFSEKLVGAPLLEFLHLFLYDIFVMLSDPNSVIRQAALQFLNSMLPKLLRNNEDFEYSGSYNKVDFDKILQSLVTTLEHPDPFVRKVAMFWVSRIVQTHMNEDTSLLDNAVNGINGALATNNLSAAAISVRNSLPHVLPGLLLSIGDTFEGKVSPSSFLPEHSTHFLAEQTNKCLQSNVQKEGKSYVDHLNSFIVALRDELDTSGRILTRNRTAAKERKPYRMDVKADGTGIESTGWYRGDGDNDDDEYAVVNIESRLCALEWVHILFEHVVPYSMKDEYAEEFISPMVRLLNDAPEIIVLKILEVLSKITIAEHSKFGVAPSLSSNSLFQQAINKEVHTAYEEQNHPMTDSNANFALGMLGMREKGELSRNREVFAALIHTHSLNPSLLSGLSRIIRKMCSLQPPEFIYISFSLELNNFVSKLLDHREKIVSSEDISPKKTRQEELRVSKYLHFVSKFVQVMVNCLLTTDETARCRMWIKDCIAVREKNTVNERKLQLFHILLNTFSHDSVAAISLCLWCGAYRTASTYLRSMDPLDLDLFFYLELDHLIEFVETRPLFRDLHLKMLESDEDPTEEGSGAMLYRLLKTILMILPQSTSYDVLQKRLLSVARFRQCAIHLEGMSTVSIKDTNTEIFVHRMVEVRKIHLGAKWRTIRSESLEPSSASDYENIDVGEGKREWLGYASITEEEKSKQIHRDAAKPQKGISSPDENTANTYFGFPSASFHENEEKSSEDVKQSNGETDDRNEEWKKYWTETT